MFGLLLYNAECPWVTVTLISNLVSRIGIDLGVYISYILLGRNCKNWCVNASWDDGVSHTILGIL